MYTKSLQPCMHWALFQFSDFQWFPLQDPQIMNSNAHPQLPNCVALECALHAVGQALAHILTIGLCLEQLPWRAACCPLPRPWVEFKNWCGRWVPQMQLHDKKTGGKWRKEVSRGNSGPHAQGRRELNGMVSWLDKAGSLSLLWHWNPSVSS